MAHHAERIGGVAPFPVAEGLDRAAIPFGGGILRAAPVAFGDMEDVVLEVLEVGVRRLRPFQQPHMLCQEQVSPVIRVGAINMIERFHRDEVMRRAAAMRDDHVLQKAGGHDGSPLFPRGA